MHARVNGLANMIMYNVREVYLCVNDDYCLDHWSFKFYPVHVENFRHLHASNEIYTYKKKIEKRNP